MSTRKTHRGSGAKALPKPPRRRKTKAAPALAADENAFREIVGGTPVEKKATQVALEVRDAENLPPLFDNYALLWSGIMVMAQDKKVDARTRRNLYAEARLLLNDLHGQLKESNQPSAPKTVAREEDEDTPRPTRFGDFLTGSLQ